MAVGKRVAGALPLAGASVAAMALAGVAVFTVSHAGCSESGRYVEHDGVVELVGSCLDPNKLPPAPAEPKQDRKPANPVSNNQGDGVNP
jgi:hypothetical protein